MGAMRRRRGPRVTHTGFALIVSGLILLSVVAGSGGLGAASFSTSDAPRSGSVDVVSDPTAALSMDVASSVHINSTDPLVTVTNQLAKSVTVTVELRDDSTHIGDLVLDGTVVGNTTTFTLAETNSQTVDITIENDSTLTSERVYFHVSGSASGIAVSAPDRNAEVNA